MRKISFLNILSISLLLIIFAFIFTISNFLFKKIFIQENNDYIINGLGAFMGAFFAFIFIRIADFISSFYSRKKRNYNALVKLAQICNENLCIARENQNQLDHFGKALNARSLFGGILQNFFIDKTIPLDLVNINLINSNFNLNIKGRKLNKSMEMVYDQYRKLEKEFLSGNKLGEKFLEENRTSLLLLINDLRAFHYDFYNETIRLLSMARIFLKDKPLNIRIISYLHKKQLTKDQILNEEARTKKEIEENINKSLKEIRDTKKIM